MNRVLHPKRIDQVILNDWLLMMKNNTEPTCGPCLQLFIYRRRPVVTPGKPLRFHTKEWALAPKEHSKDLGGAVL